MPIVSYRRWAPADLDRASMKLGRTINGDNYDSPEVQKILQENQAMARAMGNKRATSRAYAAHRILSRRRRDTTRCRVSTTRLSIGTSPVCRGTSPTKATATSCTSGCASTTRPTTWSRSWWTSSLASRLSAWSLSARTPRSGLLRRLFFNQLDYGEFLVSLGREFWVVGEAFPLGSFDEDLGVWEREELLNPEDIVIENFPLLGSAAAEDPSARLPQEARTDQAAAKEYRLLEMNFPDLIPYLLKGEHIPVSPVLLRQIGNKLNDWDDHGTPILLRGLRTLLHEEKLLASQDAIAERLYSPMILAKLGIRTWATACRRSSRARRA
jgi:hypothetical protein